MAIGTIKRGHVSHKTNRIFVPTVRRTPLMFAGNTNERQYGDHKLVVDVSGTEWLYAYFGNGVWKRLFAVE